MSSEYRAGISSITGHLHINLINNSFQLINRMAKQTNAELSINLALDTIKIKKQALIFVNSKKSAEKTAEDLSKKINSTTPELHELSQKILHSLPTPTKQCKRLSFCIEKGISFHHAGLAPKQKSLIEDAFRDKLIKIICSTPTLAYGLDLPAYRVILQDLRRFSFRGMQYISVLEYLQMSGRAGRPKYDDYGESIVVTNNEKAKNEINEIYINGRPEEIYSKLAAEPVLRTYILSLIASGFVNSKDQLLKFFEKTFWAHHYRDMWKLYSIIEKMLTLLRDWGFIELQEVNEFQSITDENNIKIKSTKIGNRVAQLYIDPLTANYFIQSLKKTKTTIPTDFSYLQIISNTLELRPLLRAKAKDKEALESVLLQKQENLLQQQVQEYQEDYQTFMNSIKTAVFFHRWINEYDEEYLLKKFDIRPGEISAKLQRAEWLLYTCTELSKLLELKEILQDLMKLRIRLKYGAKQELLPLLKFRGIGTVRARKLFNNNLEDVGAIKRVDFINLTQLIGGNIAIKIKKQVGQDFTKYKVKKGTRKGQLSLNKFK